MNLDQSYKECARFGLAGEKEDWLFSVRRGIINLDAMLQHILMTKEEKVLEVHKRKITKLESSGRWQTVVKDASTKSGWREIKLSSYEKVINKLYDFYFPENFDNIDDLRLYDIFEEWLEYKCRKRRNSPETKKQNQASYNKYVKGSKIDRMPLKSIKTIDIEEWAIDILSRYGMQSKTFNTHKIAVTGPLRYAKRKGWISENPWNKEELEYNHLFRSQRIKPSAKMIFYPDEIDELYIEFQRGYDYNGNVANLGLIINFELGLRVGELCSLKWKDINWKNETIFIQRMEDSSGNVVEYVKSDSSAGYRELALSDEALELFQRIRRDGKVLSEFVFTNADGSRANKMVFVHRLEKAENTLGWKEKNNMKRSHCIRRTVASRMDAAGWNLEEIRKWLGHTRASTTLTYIFNPFGESETRKKVKKLSILHTNKMCLQVSMQNGDILEQEKKLEAL